MIILPLIRDNFGLNYSLNILHFSDVANSSFLPALAVANACDNGIMSGLSSTEFGLDNNLTRAEACVVIQRMLEKGLLSPRTEPTTTPNTSTGSTATTTTPNTSTGTTTTTTPSTSTSTTTTPSTSTTTTARPTTAAGTAPLILRTELAVQFEKPDDAVAGSGQYDVNVYTVPADTNKDGWITYREVAAVWEQVYAKYPYNTPWTDETTYLTQNAIYGYKAGVYARGCASFAWEVSDLVFGNLPSRQVTCSADANPLEVIQPGNVFHSGTHWSVVAGTQYVEGYDMSRKWTMYDGSSNGRVKYHNGYYYDDSITSIVNGNTTLWTRYPAP